MLIQALLLACSACLTMARSARDSFEHDVIIDSSEFQTEQDESSALKLDLKWGKQVEDASSEYIDADDEGAEKRGDANYFEDYRHGHYYDESEEVSEEVERAHKRPDHHRHQQHHRPCPTTRCIKPTSTCCRRTTTDKVTTYILRRTTTTSFITSSTTKSVTVTSTSLITSSTTLTSLTTTTFSTTSISTLTSSVTTTKSNTTFTLTRTATTTLPNKTVISIVTQQIMPCFTQFETCFYNCPYYEIDPACGCACATLPTGRPEQRAHRRHRHHHKGEGRKPRRCHRKAALDLEIGQEKAAEACKPCGEAPHPVRCLPHMPEARIVPWDYEVNQQCMACQSPCRKPVYMPHDYDAQPERCIINKLPMCMRDRGDRPCQQCPMQEQFNPLCMAVANGYIPDSGCGCNSNRVYVLPCATSMCTIQPTFEPIPSCGCWNPEPTPTITVYTTLPLVCPTLDPVYVTLQPNVFCTTTIVCAWYDPPATTSTTAATTMSSA